MAAISTESIKSTENSFKSNTESYLATLVDTIQPAEAKTNLFKPIGDTFLNVH